MDRAPKLLTELVGTFVFFSVIALSGKAGPLAPLAIGAALMVMVYMGGHISGAHYNPAVSLAAFLRGKLNGPELVMYWLTQLVAAVLAFSFGNALVGAGGGIHPMTGTWQSLGVETVFTAALALVVLNVAATDATAGNSYYGLAIGFTVAAGAIVAGHISGAAFNPAVAFGATFSSAVYGTGGWGDLWIYIVAPLVGGAIGAGVHWMQIEGTSLANAPTLLESEPISAPEPEPAPEPAPVAAKRVPARRPAARAASAKRAPAKRATRRP